jgi:hypothetical protein
MAGMAAGVPRQEKMVAMAMKSVAAIKASAPSKARQADRGWEKAGLVRVLMMAPEKNRLPFDPKRGSGFLIANAD